MADTELTLDQLLDDPMVHLVMARDGLSRRDVEATVRDVRVRRSTQHLGLALRGGQYRGIGRVFAA